MTQNEYKNFLAKKFSENYSVGEFYLAKKYDLVAQNIQNESLLKEGSFLKKQVYLVSFECDEKFARGEIEKLANVTFSGFQNSMQDKTTIIVRVFVMSAPPFSLIQEIRAFKFFRGKLSPHRAYAEARVLIVDFPNGEIYSNLAGEENIAEFKIQ